MKKNISNSTEVKKYDTKGSLLKLIQENFVTFKSSAKNRNFGFLRDAIYKQLFKYSAAQIHFNEYVKSLFLILNNDILNHQDLIKLQEQKFKEIEQVFGQYQRSFTDLQIRMNSVYEIQKLIILNGKSNLHSKGSKIFFSQFGEDSWISNNIKLPKKGFFLDVGAADGITYSNTYYFEKQGWKGICFEPNPENYKLASKFRDKVFQTAVSSVTGQRKFEISDSSPDWSRLVDSKIDRLRKQKKSELFVTVKSLEQIITENGIESIDILSIDTEGTEIDVLESLNFKKINPKVIIVEYLTFGSESQKNKLLSFFKLLPYELVYTTFANLIFVHNGEKSSK